MAKGNGKKAKAAKTPQGITHITVGGYKSIAREQTIEVRPLTVLAGANSSGKSSIMQPLLLLKQTLEAPYDPGALLLNGPNVKFTSIDQMLTRVTKNGHRGKLVFGLADDEIGDLRTEFARNSQKQLYVHRQRITTPWGMRQLAANYSAQDIVSQSGFSEDFKSKEFKGTITRDRFSLKLSTQLPGHASELTARLTDRFISHLQHILHLPGMRGNRERSYPVAAIALSFPGVFEPYTASMIAHWSEEHAAERDQLNSDMMSLGLTWKVEAKRIDDTQLEVHVARLPKPSRGGAHDLVNIADVGAGVSQALPVVVAILAARPGQLVYLEDPEIRLHPRAQVAMAQLLVNAANRGVNVVVETHSSLLLLGIQSLVAEGKVTPDKVILHWFERDEDGATEIRPADLDEAGRFGDWPEDFADVSLETQMRYLKAAGKHQVE